jgi:hypothetical protein
MMGARQKMRTTKTIMGPIGSGVINAGGTTKLSTLIGNNGEGKEKNV